MALKKLPLADQSFAQIIDFNYVYADKTKYIYELVRQPKGCFFLSRPRRFGKTVLLHTFHELFSGNRERFQGLWIDASNYAFPRHPVILHSLAYDTKDKKTLSMNIISDLSKIAKKENLVIDEITPDMYLSSLIQALYKKYDSRVVALFDDYDATVTDNRGDLEEARANATVLRDYFSALKKPNVSPYLRFTLVTGITWYTQIAMDSGANHLTDISLKPQYNGLCGFTLDEFASLFGDRMEKTLARLKTNGEMDSSATLDDLRANILNWYDGYNWGGETRVLNPYSILRFFSNKSFDNYWTKTGLPGHLTSQIQKKPLYFLVPILESYRSETVLQSELTGLEVVPFLFHSGYLTLNKITTTEEYTRRYSFRLPNYEVESSYYRDCFKAVFGLDSDEALKIKGAELQTAILARDAQAVSDIFSGFFSLITYYQRLNDEMTFHSLVQVLLPAMGFKVLSKMPGATGRLDLCLELPDQVYLIIELKYCPFKINLTKNEENQALAALAMKRLPKDELDKCLADLAIFKLGNEIIYKTRFEGRGREMIGAEVNQALAEEALRSISKEDREKALAYAARTRLTYDVREVGLATAVSTNSHEREEMDRLLSETAEKALMAIAEKSYSCILGHKPQKTIELGLAISGYGIQVKAAFGPLGPKTSSRSKGRSKGAKSKAC